jgi:hypothetical protein
MVVKMTLEPFVEPHFHAASFGYCKLSRSGSVKISHSTPC